jgi:predicted nucleic acid-binding protein
LSYKSITLKEKNYIQRFLANLTIVNIDGFIRDQTIDIKKRSRLKLPDSIIAATSIVLDIPLVTSDKQFKTVPNINLLYHEK